MELEGSSLARSPLESLSLGGGGGGGGRIVVEMMGGEEVEETMCARKSLFTLARSVPMVLVVPLLLNTIADCIAGRAQKDT